MNKLKYESQRCAQASRRGSIASLNRTIDDDDDVDFFKTFVYNKKNKADCDLIKIKLKQTLKNRKLILNDRNLDIEQHFPCMLLHPELVIMIINCNDI